MAKKPYKSRSPLAPLPVDEPAACYLDLFVLAFCRWVLTLVVCREQQDYFVAVCVAKRPQQEIALSETKFEQAAAELPPEGGSADAHPLFLQNLPEGGADYAAR
jgi:hypothetical protein